MHGWTGAITAGATIVRSTDSVTSFTAGIALARLIAHRGLSAPRNPHNLQPHRDLRQGHLARHPPDHPALALACRHQDQHLPRRRRTRLVLHPRLYALANTAFDHNYLSGPGPPAALRRRRRLDARPNRHQQLDLKADIHYERQSFFGQPEVNLIGSIFGEAYHRDLPHKIVFTQAADYIPSWNNSQAYSAMFTAGIVLPTWKRLGASTSPSPTTTSTTRRPVTRQTPSSSSPASPTPSSSTGKLASCADENGKRRAPQEILVKPRSASNPHKHWRKS